MPSLNTLKTHYRRISIGEIQFPEREGVEETGTHIYIHMQTMKHSHMSI